METEEHRLEEQPDSELMKALVAADRSRAKLEPLLRERALALLSKVPGFPWEGGIHREKVDAEHVGFDLTGTGRIIVRVPVYWMGNETRQHELKAQLMALPGVEVKAEGAFVTGLQAWQVWIDPKKLPTPELATTGAVRENVEATLHG